MRMLLFSLLLVFTSISSVCGVQTGSLAEDKKALTRGKNAKNVCYISFSFGKDENDKPHYLGSGTGSLIEPDVIVTAGHNIHDTLEDFLFSPDSAMGKQQGEKLLKKLKKGKPISLSGLATFVPDVHQAMAQYAQSENSKYLSQTFYEIDAVIMHPSYDYDDGDAETDLAFIKLKKPATTIAPLLLYKEGIMPSLELHELNNLDMKGLIKGHFVGYGSDVSGRYGKKRAVSQLCFLEDDSDSESSESETCQGCCVRGGVTPHQNIKNVIPLTDYVPTPQIETDFEIDNHDFLNALLKQKKEGEVYGLLHRGDSGGPFIIKDEDGKQYIAGVESTQGGGQYQTGSLTLQSQVETFQDVQKIGRTYESFLCPLFTLEGKLRPEIPEMIDQLKEFPTSPDSNLKELVLQEKPVFDAYDAYASSIESLNATIHDMDQLLRFKFLKKNSKKQNEIKKKLALKKLKEIEIKYAKKGKEKIMKDENPFHTSLPLDLRKAQKLLRNDKFKSFKNEINEKKESIREHKAKFIQSLGLRE